MSVQSLIASNPSLTRFLMSRLPASVHEARAPKFANRVVRHAVERTNAYPAFLIMNGIDPARAAAMPFDELPVTSKKEYLDVYPLADLTAGGDVSRSYVIEKSSGMGGGCYYWPRLAEYDKHAVSEIEAGLKLFYSVDKTPTLLLVTFALGTWIGGVKLAQWLRDVAATGKYPITVVAPGVNVDEILQIVRDLGPNYEQTLMFGYPPLLKTVLDRGLEAGMDWPSYNVKMMTGGEGLPEEWRAQVVRTLGGDPERELLRVRGGYGAADLGTGIGQEYPFTVLLRRLCLADASLAKDVFGRKAVPDVFQYNTTTSYVEEMDGELLFTVDAAVPLVRYRIHDAGGIIPFDTAFEALRDHGYDPEALLAEKGFAPADLWRLPLMYVYGRADGTCIVGGANVYPENIQAVLAQAGDSDVTGYKLTVSKGRMHVTFELRRDHLSKDEARLLEKGYHSLIVKGLQRVNAEYRDQFRANPRVADPVVKVFATASGPFREDIGRLKRRYTVEGHPEAA